MLKHWLPIGQKIVIIHYCILLQKLTVSKKVLKVQSGLGSVNWTWSWQFPSYLFTRISIHSQNVNSWAWLRVLPPTVQERMAAVNPILPYKKVLHANRGCPNKYHKIWDKWLETVSTYDDYDHADAYTITTWPKHFRMASYVIYFFLSMNCCFCDIFYSPVMIFLC